MRSLCIKPVLPSIRSTLRLSRFKPDEPLKMYAGRPVSLKPLTTLEVQILRYGSCWYKKPRILRTRTAVSNRCLSTLARRIRQWKTLSKKALKPAFKRELATHMITTFELSFRLACRSLNLSRTVYHYRTIPRGTNPLLSRCRQWPSDTHDTVFRNFSDSEATGTPVESQKDPPYLLSTETEFFRRKGKQRLPVRKPSPLATPEALNQSRSMMHWSAVVVFARSMSLMTLTVRRCRLKSIWICQLCTWSVCLTGSRQIAAILTCYA